MSLGVTVWDSNKAIDIGERSDLGRWSVREVLLYFVEELNSVDISYY